ncbi:MAG: ABC transporter permease [Myxococcaceae bacterium]|nr:ABC transporter permease [Myxococcaceae bacterium]MCI0672656.1 ABC transporter permease [Myxococcaceae bacterium]
MVRPVLRRLVLLVPTFLGATLLAYALLHLPPGEPVLLGGDAHGNQVALEVAGVGRPESEGLLRGYATWLTRGARLELGRTLGDGRPVVERIREALPRTLLLSGLALGVAWTGALVLGALVAAGRGRAVDGFIGLVCAVLVALPGFWVALTLLSLLASARGLPLFPLQGLVSEGHAQLDLLARARDVAWHLVLPVASLSLAALGTLTRHARAALLGALSEGFVRAARARGGTRSRVVLRHALPHALTPLVALAGALVPGMLGGSVLVEHVFGIPGMGLLTLEAVQRRDEALVMAVTALAAAVTLLAHLGVDACLLWLSPRLRASEA